MKAMIFAAGLGTRLKPLTDTMPKALVPVGGQPLLQILLERLIQSGFTDVVINVHHFGQQIIDFVHDHPFDISISISDERNCLLDTGGGIKKASCFFTDGEPFLVHNVDILSNVNLRKFYEDYRNNDATLLVSERETSRYLLFNEDSRLVGWTNIQTGEVKSPYKHLDVNACRKYAFAGIHMFSPHLFPFMQDFGPKFPIIDFYLSVAREANIRCFLKEDLRMVDVGKINTLQTAEAFLKKETLD